MGAGAFTGGGAQGADAQPRRPDPRALRLWMVAGGAGSLVVSVPLAVIFVLANLAVVSLALVLLGAVVGALYGRAQWRSRSWLLGQRALELRHGVVVQRASSVPYLRIQQIDVERGPLDRLIGLAQLKVRTAAATTDGTIYGLDLEDAARIRQRLLDLAGVDDAV